MSVIYIPQQENWADAITKGVMGSINLADMASSIKLKNQQLELNKLANQRADAVLGIQQEEAAQRRGLYPSQLMEAESQAIISKETAKRTPTILDKQIEQVNATVANQMAQAESMRQSTESQKIRDAREALNFNRVSALQDLTALAPNMVQAAISKDNDRLGQLSIASQKIIDGSVSNYATQYKAAFPDATNEQVTAALEGYKGSLIVAKNDFTNSVNKYMNLAEVSTRAGVTKPNKEVQKLTGVEETESNITADDLRILGVAGQLVGQGTLNMSQVPDFVSFTKKALTGQGATAVAPEQQNKERWDKVASELTTMSPNKLANSFGGQGEQMKALAYKKSSLGTDIPLVTKLYKPGVGWEKDRAITFDEAVKLHQEGKIKDEDFWNTWSLFLDDAGFSFDAANKKIVPKTANNSTSTPTNTKTTPSGFSY